MPCHPSLCLLRWVDLPGRIKYRISTHPCSQNQKSRLWSNVGVRFSEPNTNRPCLTRDVPLQRSPDPIRPASLPFAQRCTASYSSPCVRQQQVVAQATRSSLSVPRKNSSTERWIDSGTTCSRYLLYLMQEKSTSTKSISLAASYGQRREFST